MGAEHFFLFRTVARNEQCGTIATETPLTGYEPNLFDTLEDYEGIDAIFRDKNFTQLIDYDSDGQYPDPTEVDDEHLRSEFASPLPRQERGARTDLTQIHHSNEESLLTSAPLISTRTRKPSSKLNEQESSQGLEDEIFMSVLQVQREQILAETKKYDEKASFAENYIRNLRSQIDSRDSDLRRTLEGTWKPVKLKIDFNKRYQTKNEFYMKIVSKGFAK